MWYDTAGTPLFDQFHETLTLEVDAEVLPLGSRLSTQSFQSSYSKVLQIIASDRLLAAPFYRFETSAFEVKWAEVEEFNRLLDVGMLVLDEMFSGKEESCAM
jgi:hypothetical protein